MTVFLFDWATRTSLLIDDADERSAREVARSVAEGVEPSMVRAMPHRVVVLELFTETVTEAGDELEELRVVPLPHVEQALFDLLEDEGDAPALRLVEPVAAVCGHEADDPQGHVVRCDRPRGHAAAHAFGGLTWESP